MGFDIVANGVIEVDKKKSDEMKKRNKELVKKGVDFEEYPADLKKYIEKNLDPNWDPSDGTWPVGHVEIDYNSKDLEDGNIELTINLARLPKGVKKIVIGSC